MKIVSGLSVRKKIRVNEDKLRQLVKVRQVSPLAADRSARRDKSRNG